MKALTSRAEALKLSHTENVGRSRGDRDSLKLMSTKLLVLQSTLDQSNCVIANLTRELDAERAGGQASAEELTRVQEKLDELDVHVGRGRPDGHRAYAGHRELALKWGTMSTANRSRAMRRHTADISDIFDANGADNWSPAALARVLVDKGLLDQLMGTRPFARKKLELVVALREVLTAEWNAELACFIVNELELSNRKYSKLRLALCKAHDEFWRKKVWYQCPVTGKVINMPEPLVSNHVWKARMTEKLKPYDLQLSDDGKISQRAMLVTLKANLRRDAAHLRDFTKEDPAFPCFGIDHAAISRVREFSHGGLTMGGCYRGDAPISEMKHTTLVVGQHHDDAAGLEKMLGPQKDRGVVGIAREFEALDEARELDLDGECVPCIPKICLDLAAARGMRKCRGKAACLCACATSEQLQSYPGQLDPPIRDLPSGNTIADFFAARDLAQSQCSYGSELMEYPSLRSSAHLLPEGYDFSVSGAWSCPWCGDEVWTEKGQLEADMARLLELREGAKFNKELKAELDKELKAHAELHASTIKYEDQVIKVGTNRYIVDPLHCLLLNLAKTAWKYSFGDVMNPDDRELVAAYLTEIRLHLDIREKGKREQSQKWFSGAQFDEFVVGVLNGSRTSKSPGLARNILAIVELVYDAPTDAPAVPAPDVAPAPAPAPKKKATSRRARQAAPIGGFVQPDAPTSGPASDATAVFVTTEDLASLDEYDQYSAKAPEIVSHLKSRYGNNASSVFSVLSMWEAYGRLYAAWRDKWESRTLEYRAIRCLRLARAARDFAQALKSVSDGKHKPWYVHMTTWIVWQQMWEVCDTWQLSTVAIETRGARIKRYGRTLPNWRPLVGGYTVYKYVSRQTGELKEELRTYKSSPMHQLLQRLLMSEESWHDDAGYNIPERLRLQATLQSQLLKLEIDDDTSRPRLPRPTMLSELAAINGPQPMQL